MLLSRAETALLEYVRYFVTDDDDPHAAIEARCAVYVLRRERDLAWFDFGSGATIDEAAHALRRTVPTTKDDSWVDPARTLARLALDPLTSAIEGVDHLCVVPAGTLAP